MSKPDILSDLMRLAEKYRKEGNGWGMNPVAHIVVQAICADIVTDLELIASRLKEGK